ncbi:unnamed protein product [Clonostachys solani]|uniref:Protein kinase domain-containing protein n=1 Tax=Clonostachys solani TaxID=160281 RepID=A0A9N9ZQN1_9HYPO|nr:unnamed protein product [Clonostachys solani]
MGQWWVAQRIDDTVTRQFVEKHLVRDEIELLDKPVGFSSEALTERTYWESIQQNAKRMFLILVDIGLPDQIFGIVDDGWEDAELPLATRDVERLELTAAKDERVDRKFYQRQFHYLVRTIEGGEHLSFSDQELVPLDVVEKTPHLSSKGSQVEKVRLPNIPGKTFIRRKYQLGKFPEATTMTEFLEMVNAIKHIQNRHLISYWASYTHQGFNYLLLTPLSDFNLKSFLSSTPSTFKALPKKTRRELVVNWILCLVDTVCFLHSKNLSHSYLKPSAVLFTHQNSIFLVDPTRLSSTTSTSQEDKASFDREWYDFAAPEQWQRPSGPGSPPSRRSILASLSASPEDNTPGISQFGGPRGSPAMPSPGQQADIFSLGCIILELLSYLLKRSGSKFASFRAAKHKQAGRGGAVLDSSFHKNLDQVENWMSNLAKDASKKASDKDGANVFRGYTPILHVVTEMLAANPFERPPAHEILQRIYQILRQNCGISEPHCVNHYPVPSTQAFPFPGQVPIHDAHFYRQPRVLPAHPYSHTGVAFGSPESPPPLLHHRTNSSSEYSRHSRTSSVTTGSSDRDDNMEITSAAARGIPSPRPIRPHPDRSRMPLYANQVHQGPVYSGGPHHYG